MSFILAGGVGQLKVRPFVLISAGLQVWYKFEDTITTDSSGNGRNGTLTGSPLPVLTTGRVGNAMSFTNVVATGTGRVTMPLSLMTLPSYSTPISFTAFFSTNQTTIPWPVAICRYSSGSDDIFFGVDYNGYNNGYTGAATFLIRDNLGNYATANGTTNLLDGKFHHLCGTYDGVSSLKIYADGVLQNTASIALNAGVGPDSAQIGYDPGAPWGLYGVVDEFRIYNRALSASEVAQIAAGQG